MSRISVSCLWIDWLLANLQITIANSQRGNRCWKAEEWRQQEQEKHFLLYIYIYSKHEKKKKHLINWLSFRRGLSWKLGLRCVTDRGHQRLGWPWHMQVNLFGIVRYLSSTNWLYIITYYPRSTCLISPDFPSTGQLQSISFFIKKKS